MHSLKHLWNPITVNSPPIEGIRPLWIRRLKVQLQREVCAATVPQPLSCATELAQLKVLKKRSWQIFGHHCIHHHRGVAVIIIVASCVISVTGASPTCKKPGRRVRFHRHRRSGSFTPIILFPLAARVSASPAACGAKQKDAYIGGGVRLSPSSVSSSFYLFFNLTSLACTIGCRQPPLP